MGEQKPLLVLIHQSNNGACKALEPQDPKFRPEGVNGGDYPRIIFLRPDGTRIDGIQGPSSQHTAYFSKPAQIVEAMRAALLATGLDLDADEKAAVAALEAAEREAAEKYRTSVPGMLESIFAIVDEDKDQKLNHPEFATFIKHSKGQVHTPVQYERMCKLHGSDGGLTFDKMRDVYASRSADELREQLLLTLAEPARVSSASRNLI